MQNSLMDLIHFQSALTKKDEWKQIDKQTNR